MRTWPLAVVVLVALGGCAPAPRAPDTPAASPERSTAPPPSAAATVYDVDSRRSELRVFVYRAGTLARLGHNHVLISRELRGEVAVPTDAAGVRFALAFPVATLAVDEAEARAAAGPDFESRPSAQDVEGTRRNLLGPQVLDAERHPEIKLTATGASGGPDDWRVRVDVQVRGRTTSVEAPAHVVRGADGLVATGELRVAQSALGITPISVALGALQVQDELTVRYTVAANRRH